MKQNNEKAINRLTGWFMAGLVVGLLFVTSHPVKAPVSCEGKMLCLFILE